jgi:hypothetical protein
MKDEFIVVCCFGTYRDCCYQMCLLKKSLS